MIRHAAATVVALCLSTSPLYAQNTVKLTVSEASANVHKSPSTGSPVIGKAPKGTALVVTREVGDWVKVSWPSAADGAGYVRANAGTIARGDAAPAPAVAKAAPKPAAAPAKAGAKPAASTAKAGAKPAASTAKAAAAPAGAGAKAEAASLAPVGAKAAVAATPTAAPMTIAAREEQIPVARPAAPTPARTLYVAPTHNFGLGMVAGGSTMGFGASARAWSKKHLGFQLEVSRSSFESATVLGRATSTSIAPSILYAMNDKVTDYLWLRPYFGVGAQLGHASLTDPIFPDVTTTANTLGAKVFFGGEMAFSSIPQFSLSLDAGYYKLPEPFMGFDPSGMGFAISGHWYVK
jgi:hypothetical protein